MQSPELGRVPRESTRWKPVPPELREWKGEPGPWQIESPTRDRDFGFEFCVMGSP